MARRIVAFSALIVLTLAAGLLVYGLVGPVHGVAPGCSLFTGTEVVSAGVPFSGCIKGYYLTGGEIAQTDDATSYSLNLDLTRARCDFRPHELIIVRGHTVTDEGHIVVAVEACG